MTVTNGLELNDTSDAAGAEKARSVKLVRAGQEADEKYVGQTAVVKQVRIVVGEGGAWERVEFVAEFPNGASKNVPLDDAEIVEFWPPRAGRQDEPQTEGKE